MTWKPGYDNSSRQTDRQQKTQLPIFSAKSDLLKYFQKCSTCVVIGETASGKTTRIPEFLFEAGFAEGTCRILCTQPRRVAAITVATYMAGELGCRIGETVGYTVRFEDVTSESTKIKYATDGIILREAMSDSLLSKYSVIVIDEAHERSLQTDILLGVVKKAQYERARRCMKPNLKIIVMSATLNVELFSTYFDNAPILYVEGRTHPVSIYHLTPSSAQNDDYLWTTLVATVQIHRTNPVDGDILVFLTGEEEIESAARTLRTVAKEFDRDETAPINVIPLYSALPPESQMRSFRMPDKKECDEGARRIILSTNIAETSVTIPNIKYVIDSGKVKEKCYNARSGIEFLQVKNESMAQARQRAGRAGRLGPGECYYLFSKEEYSKLNETTDAEILKSNLEHVVLQLICYGIHNVLEFDFIEKPPTDLTNGAVKTLLKLDAISETSFKKFELTDLGKLMVKFPLQPEYSLALILARDGNCLDDVLSIISMLSVENVFITRAPAGGNDKGMSEEHIQKLWSKFQHYSGDLIGLLILYRQINGLSSPAAKKNFCFENCLNIRNITMALKIRNQLSKICVSLGWKCTSCGSDFDKVRLCLSKAFRQKIAVLGTEKKYYTLCGRVQVFIHPTSSLYKNGCLPSAVIYNELVETSKTYMRGVSIVNEDWLPQIHSLSSSSSSSQHSLDSFS